MKFRDRQVSEWQILNRIIISIVGKTGKQTASHFAD